MTRGEFGNPGDMSSPRPLEQLVAPFRQAQSLLGKIREAARNIADEGPFNQLLNELSALPAAATFSPLQAACQLPVDIPPAQQSVLQEAESKRQFMAALQQGARERSVRAGSPGEKAATRQGITVNGMASEPPAAALSEITTAFNGIQRQVIAIQKNATEVIDTERGATDIIDTERHATEVFMGELPPVPSVSDPREPFRPPFPGSWGALERIAELVQFLEPQASSGAAHVPAPQTAGQPVGTSTKDGVTSSGSGARGEQMAQASPPTTGRSAGESESAATGAAALQALVTAAWEVTQTQTERQDRKAPGASAGRKVRDTLHNADSEMPARMTVAPRSPSMLSPQLAPKPASSSAGGIITPNAAAVGDAGRSQQERSWPAPQSGPANHDEELAEQLNRVLIEQAWRGGVDLT